MEGWVKIHRKFCDWGWYSDGNTTRVFLHLLLNANIDSKEFRGYTIHRGQVVVGRLELSRVLNITERGVRTALKHLENTNEITIKTTNKFSVVTICKFDDYQGEKNTNDQQLTNKRPTTDQQLTTIKEYKNERIKEDNITHSPARACENPKFEQIVEFVKNRCGEIDMADAEKFWHHYEAIGWIDGNARRITNWQSRLINWSRDERMKKAQKIAGGINKRRQLEIDTLDANSEWR